MTCGKGRGLKTPLVVLLCFILSASVAWAGSNNGKVTLRLQEAPLTTAIALLTQQAQVVVAKNQDLTGKTVTVNLVEQPIEKALDVLLTANGIPWYKGEDGIYYINATRPEPPKPETPAVPEVVVPKRFIVTEKIELYHRSPEEILRELGIEGGILDRRPPLEVPIPQVYNPQSGRTEPARIIHLQSSLNPANAKGPASSATPNGGSQGGNDLLQQTFPPVPGPSASDQDTAGRTPGDLDVFGQVPGFPQPGRRPGFVPRPGVPTPTVPGQPTPTAPGVPGAPGAAPGAVGGVAGRGFVPEGIQLVAGLLADNSLLVQGDPDAIDELRTIVQLLDVAPAQVAIKVDIVQVSANAQRQMGGNWAFFTREANIFAQPGVPGSGLIVDVLRGNLQATIAALVTRGQGRVIASPLITTMNNTFANVFQTTQTPIFVPLLTQTQTAVTTVTVPQFIAVETGLQVLPRINRDGTITLNVTPTLSNISRFVTSPDGTNIAPEFQQTGTVITRRVRSGETLVIAGLTTKNISFNETKIPILGDIPLVGRLFRNRSRTTNETQMLIFLTPTIVSEVGGGMRPEEVK